MAFLYTMCSNWDMKAVSILLTLLCLPMILYADQPPQAPRSLTKQAKSICRRYRENPGRLALRWVPATRKWESRCRPHVAGSLIVSCRRHKNSCQITRGIGQ